MFHKIHDFISNSKWFCAQKRKFTMRTRGKSSISKVQPKIESKLIFIKLFCEHFQIEKLFNKNQVNEGQYCCIFGAISLEFILWKNYFEN